MKLGFSLQSSYSMPLPQVIDLLAQTGFCAVSPAWKQDGSWEEAVCCAQNRNLIVQSLHGPTQKTFELWNSDKNCSQPILQEMLNCVDGCAQYGIPVMVVHSWLGKQYTFRKDSLYFDNFNRLVDYAGSKNVGIAFENLEGPEYLAALMSYYTNCETVGLCWDSGHELCYNLGWDFLRDYGDRLMMTHLNDNFGLTSPDGTLLTTDDLHLIPGDGKTDWSQLVEKLMRSKRQDILNFELKIRPKGDRCITDLYSKIPLEHYITQAYNSACHAVSGYFK